LRKLLGASGTKSDRENFQKIIGYMEKSRRCKEYWEGKGDKGMKGGEEVRR
jgi:hypothetical protein